MNKWLSLDLWNLVGHSSKPMPFFVFSRNKRKVCREDEQLYSTDEVKIKNGLECKIACGSSKVTLLSSSLYHAYRLWVYPWETSTWKHVLENLLQVSYVLETEDLLVRVKKRRKTLCHNQDSWVRQMRLQYYKNNFLWPACNNLEEGYQINSTCSFTLQLNRDKTKTKVAILHCWLHRIEPNCILYLHKKKKQQRIWLFVVCDWKRKQSLTKMMLHM